MARDGRRGVVPDDVATVVISAAKILDRVEPFDIAPGDTLAADLGPLGRITTAPGAPDQPRKGREAPSPAPFVLTIEQTSA